MHGKSIVLSVLIGMLIGFAVFALLGMRVDEHVEAAEPAALAIDPMTGLPAGAVRFEMDGMSCLALPDGQFNCFCPCETGSCAAPVVVTETRVVTVPVVVTRTVTVPVSVPNVPEDTPADVPDETPAPVPDTEPQPDPEPSPEPDPQPEPEPEPEDDDKPKGNNGVGNGEDPQPPGNPPVNDGPGTSPGNPGSKGGHNGNKGGNGNGGGKGKDK